MKKTVLILVAGLISSLGFAKAEMYLVEPMKCTGRLVSNNPDMHDSWKNKIYEYEFTSFKTTRRGGLLADALEIVTSTTSNYYLSPLFVQPNGVIEKDMGGYDEVLRLQIVSSKIQNGQRFDKLVGTISAQGTVVGDTVYKLNCTARVVKSVKRIDNYTRR